MTAAQKKAAAKKAAEEPTNVVVTSVSNGNNDPLEIRSHSLAPLVAAIEQEQWVTELSAKERVMLDFLYSIRDKLNFIDSSLNSMKKVQNGPTFTRAARYK